MDSYNLSLVETQQIEKVLVKGYRASDRVTMTDDKYRQPSTGVSVGVTSDLTYGCLYLSKESLGDYKRIDNIVCNSPHIDPHQHFIKKRRRNCKYYATSVHLLCAVNPMTTTCEGCPHFEEKAG